MNLKIVLILLRGVVCISLICFGVEVVGNYKQSSGLNLDWAIVVLLLVGVVFSIAFIGKPISDAFEEKKKE
ncbi:hypothetical protein [Alcanivorax sp.]|uniref:hypothetical protein n=1 Tax=Alcanivorax sp. TaxID=1872427 RepID=UPI002B26A890|nr:hypothetical protein [Alcanivorax sp.]